MAAVVNNNDHYANAAANNNHNVDDDPNDDDDDQICQEAIEILQNRLIFPSRLRDQTIACTLCTTIDQEYQKQHS